jgi:hypothetical protein
MPRPAQRFQLWRGYACSIRLRAQSVRKSLGALFRADPTEDRDKASAVAVDLLDPPFFRLHVGVVEEEDLSLHRFALLPGWDIDSPDRQLLWMAATIAVAPCTHYLERQRTGD